jgi:3-dehydroquinate synthase
VVKYGVILDAKFFEYLEAHTAGLLRREPDVLRHVVARCCRLKADVVEQDEREETGLRETLNFGHTAGHAFEMLSGGKLPHGEAVLWGLLYALKLSAKLGVLDNTPGAAKITGLIEPLPLPAACRRPSDFLKLVRADKKRGGRENRFLLLRSPGDVEPTDNIPEKVLLAAMEEL